MSAKILIVEDDAAVREPLASYLTSQGYTVTAVSSLTEARKQTQFNLAVLDWNLSDGEGIDLIKEWRSQGNLVPVMMLTARTDLTDRVLGLELGAHDYMTKPFEPRELLARVRVQLRKTESPGADLLQAHGISIHLAHREVSFKGQKLQLTKMEFDLLKLFLENPGKVFSRDELLNKVWGFDQFPSTRTVDTHMLQLRQKTSDDIFETVRGIGYRMKK